MSLSAYVAVWFGYANIFIALFIAVYAYLFLKKTNQHRDRRPWDFLFLASVAYLLFQIFNVIFLSGISSLSRIDIGFVSNLMSFLYSGCVLLAFVSQHDLILRSQIILISKRDDDLPAAESNVQVKIGTKRKK